MKSFTMKRIFYILILLIMVGTVQRLDAQTNRRVKVACVGNSITEGVGSGDSELYSYPAQLAELLGANYKVRNFGKSGHTLMTVSDRPWIKTEKWRQLKRWKPEIVIVKLGTNDSKPMNALNIASDLKSELNALIDSIYTIASVKKLYICSPIPSYGENRYKIDGEVISQQIVPAIQAVATERGISFIDLHKEFGHHPEYLPDNIHPSKDGAALIANILYKHITSQLSIYLCIGQSNMAGRAPLVGKTTKMPLDSVYLFNNDNEFEPALNPLNRYSSIRKDISMQRLSIAYSFAKEIRELTGETIGLVCNARGETSIKHWQKGADRGYYEEAIKRTKEAMKYGIVKGVIWHQGEYDCQGDLEEYRRLLAQLINDLREDLNNPNLPFVVGQISQWNWTDTAQGTKPFNDMILKVSDEIPNAACASSEGLKPAFGEHDPHFSAKGQRLLGQRYAECMAQLFGLTNSNVGN